MNSVKTEVFSVHFFICKQSIAGQDVGLGSKPVVYTKCVDYSNVIVV